MVVHDSPSSTSRRPHLVVPVSLSAPSPAPSSTSRLPESSLGPLQFRLSASRRASLVVRVPSCESRRPRPVVRVQSSCRWHPPWRHRWAHGRRRRRGVGRRAASPWPRGYVWAIVIVSNNSNNRKTDALMLAAVASGHRYRHGSPGGSSSYSSSGYRLRRNRRDIVLWTTGGQCPLLPPDRCYCHLTMSATFTMTTKLQGKITNARDLSVPGTLLLAYCCCYRPSSTSRPVEWPPAGPAAPWTGSASSLSRRWAPSAQAAQRVGVVTRSR